jgi:hypothetical protein
LPLLSIILSGDDASEFPRGKNALLPYRQEGVLGAFWEEVRQKDAAQREKEEQKGTAEENPTASSDRVF